MERASVMPKAPRVLRPRKAKRVERRPNSHQRGYTHKWEKASRAWLEEQFAQGNIYCGECGKVLSGSRSDIVVDHIVDHKGDMDKFWDQDNWQALHRKPCHSRKTMRQNAPH